MRYELFTDMSIDAPVEVYEKSGVHFIPMDYILGTETHHCAVPENDETMHYFYEKLRQKEVTQTSQITPYHYEEAFRPFVEKGIGLIYLCLSSGLSKTYDSARLAVENLKEDYENVNIEVVDTLGATGGMGLLLESAMMNRDAGMSLEENAEWLREHTKLINYWFKVEDLMYLMRGGRVSATTAIVGTALNIKPILTIRPDGTLDTIAKKRGSKQAMHHILNLFENNFDETAGDIVYVIHADVPDEAAALKKALLEKHPNLKIRTTMLCPIIGSHTGPGLCAAVYYGTNRE